MSAAETAALAVTLWAGRPQAQVLAAAIRRALIAYKNTEDKKA
jgi:hypothetical protein